MTDYKAYRAHVGINNVEMTDAVHTIHPGFTKVTASMVNAPERYGVCLLPEAERHLVLRYGEGPGLSSVEFDGEAKVKPRSHPHRKKGNAVTFRMNDELYKRAVTLKEKSGFATMQELLETLLLDYLDRNAPGRHEK